MGELGTLFGMVPVRIRTRAGGGVAVWADSGRALAAAADWTVRLSLYFEPSLHLNLHFRLCGVDTWSSVHHDHIRSPGGR
eukprot:COSAG03_NODE_405_length_8175_cov_4.098935_1_plen_80_part_00